MVDQMTRLRETNPLKARKLRSDSCHPLLVTPWQLMNRQRDARRYQASMAGLHFKLLKHHSSQSWDTTHPTLNSSIGFYQMKHTMWYNVTSKCISTKLKLRIVQVHIRVAIIGDGGIQKFAELHSKHVFISTQCTEYILVTTPPKIFYRQTP